MKSINIFSLIILLLLTSCANRRHEGAHADVAQDLDSIFSKVFPNPDEPGAIVYVVCSNKVIFNKGYGVADLSTGQPMTDSTVVNLCSISKQFTTFALLRLATEGRISLSDNVAMYFPEFKSPVFRDVTISSLLNHTSGIPDSRPRTPEQWEAYKRLHPDTPFADLNDYMLHAQSDESVRYLEDLDSLAFEPGSKYEYQNPTFQLGELIVERVTGLSLAEWMKQNCFDPSGMDHTFYYEPDTVVANMAHGYEMVDSVWVERDYGETPFFPSKGDGGLYTTARDFRRWVDATLNCEVIDVQSMFKGMTPNIDVPELPYTGYGLGIFVETKPDKPLKIFHTGENGGFYTYECSFPSLGISYVIFANRPGWDRSRIVEQIDSVLEAKEHII